MPRTIQTNNFRRPAIERALTLPAASLSDIDCPVIVMPADANQKWRTASRDALIRLSRIDPQDKDCKEIHVEVRDAGAVVTLTTQDGRRASRPVAGPDEVVPVINALVVGIPVAQASASESSSSESQSAVKPSASVDTGKTADAEANQPAVASFAWTATLGAMGGGRLTYSGGRLSPLAGLSAGVLLNRVEIGFGASRDFGYRANAPTALQRSAWTLELFGGWCQPVGDFNVIAGMRGGIAFVQEQFTTTDIDNTSTSGDATGDQSAIVAHSAAELRIGGYVALEWPAKWSLRLRLQLGLDGTVTRFGTKTNLGIADAEVASEVPAFPSIGANSTLGLQWSFL